MKIEPIADAGDHRPLTLQLVETEDDPEPAEVVCEVAAAVTPVTPNLRPAERQLHVVPVGREDTWRHKVAVSLAQGREFALETLVHHLHDLDLRQAAIVGGGGGGGGSDRRRETVKLGKVQLNVVAGRRLDEVDAARRTRRPLVVRCGNYRLRLPVDPLAN